MNYLAHALLAGSDVGFLLGGMAGDFYKGRTENISDRAVQRGVRLHRRIDGFTDAHPVCARSRRRIPEPRRRFAGIIVDVVYDHYLATHWARFGTELGLEVFTAGVYRTLAAHGSGLPLGFRSMVPRMCEQDWLGSYRDLALVGWALDRIAGRVRRGEALQGAIDDIEASYGGLEGDFFEFFPELVGFAHAERARLSRA
jgi:acyl carrier protein phosphodiesterase